MNTYGYLESVSNKRTYKPPAQGLTVFRMNTYEKQGEGVGTLLDLALVRGAIYRALRSQTRPISRTMKNIAATPANNTPPSSITDIRCNFPNSASSGSPSAVA
jgi:hypothetical protein